VTIQTGKPFEDYLIELGARALCKMHVDHHSPDDLQMVFECEADYDGRRKRKYGDPYWMKYRADAKCVLDAMFGRVTVSQESK